MESGRRGAGNRCGPYVVEAGRILGGQAVGVEGIRAHGTLG